MRHTGLTCRTLIRWWLMGWMEAESDAMAATAAPISVALLTRHDRCARLAGQLYLLDPEG